MLIGGCAGLVVVWVCDAFEFGLGVGFYGLPGFVRFLWGWYNIDAVGCWLKFWAFTVTLAVG